MNILDKLSWWLFKPKWQKEQLQLFNNRIDRVIEENDKLGKFCKMMDAAIGDVQDYTIVCNREFLKDYRGIFGSNASLMMYDGRPIVLKDQPEYFKVLDKPKII